MGLTVSVMNPPRKKKRRSGKPSAKQLAARRLFAQRFGGKKSKKRTGGKKRRASTSTRAHAPTHKKGHTMAKKKKGKGRSSRKRHSYAPRFGRGGGIFGAAKGIVGEVKSAAPLIAGGFGGFVAAPKLADFLTMKKDASGTMVLRDWAKKADGSADPNKRLAAKAGIVAALFIGAKMAGMHGVSRGVLVGGSINVLYDVASRYAPASVLPSSLMGGDFMAGDGRIDARAFAAMGGGMGANYDIRQFNRASLNGAMPG